MEDEEKVMIDIRTVEDAEEIYLLKVQDLITERIEKNKYSFDYNLAYYYLEKSEIFKKARVTAEYNKRLSKITQIKDDEIKECRDKMNFLEEKKDRLLRTLMKLERDDSDE
jgi:DNA-binding ferritin-like protein